MSDRFVMGRMVGWHKGRPAYVKVPPGDLVAETLPAEPPREAGQGPEAGQAGGDVSRPAGEPPSSPEVP